MANGELTVLSDCYSYFACDHIVRKQSSRWDFRPFYGYRCDLWENDWDNCQGHVHVRGLGTWLVL